MNSGFLDGLTVKEAIPTMKKWVTEQGIGRPKTNFKLRDWVFSRQRYWGEPIPLVNCPKCGWVPLPEEQLPLLLPEVDSYEVTDTGESPLSKMTDWVNTTCPKCGGPAQRETDTMRLYIMFIGDFEKAATWSNDAVKGSKRFLDRVWNLAESASDSYDVTPANEAVIHKTIKKVTEDVDSLKMNTAIAAMMTMVNELNANGCTRGDLKYLLLLLNPFAPHITEELWENLGFAAQTGKMCCQAEWPVADESKTVASTVELAVQVNGKLKGTISMPTDSEEKAVVDAALAVEKVRKATEGMQIIKTILVKNRLVNLIVKPAK